LNHACRAPKCMTCDSAGMKPGLEFHCCAARSTFGAHNLTSGLFRKLADENPVGIQRNFVSFGG